MTLGTNFLSPILPSYRPFLSILESFIPSPRVTVFGKTIVHRDNLQQSIREPGVTVNHTLFYIYLLSLIYLLPSCILNIP
jgi:hypothetical protein